MSIAARQLGDYSKWQQIANINGLLPPYFAAVPTPNMVSPGQQLYLPTDGIPANVVPAQGAASYEISFLGYDIFYGALNQDMAPWTGDFVTISGYSNLAFSLGRRLQTPLGNLIYHMDFGSRIPPEVGNILTQDTVGHIGAFAVSAVLSDPRVQQVVSVNAQALTNQGVSVSLVALPKGQTNSSGSGVPVGVSFTPSQIGANPRPTALMDNAGNLLYDTTGNILIGSS
jgi:phage baseplate assembly protein W